MRFSARERLKFAMKASMRWAVVAIAVCSWLAISNHCAFAAVATRGPGCQSVSDHRRDADAAQCPFHSRPAKPNQEPSQLQCCKVLRAVVLGQAKSWARDNGKFFDFDLPVEEFALITLLRSARVSSSLDTGPPAACSFAELILQRSLLAHAPPLLA